MSTGRLFTALTIVVIGFLEIFVLLSGQSHG